MATAIDRGHAVAVMGEVVNEPDVNDKGLHSSSRLLHIARVKLSEYSRIEEGR